MTDLQVKYQDLKHKKIIDTQRVANETKLARQNQKLMAAQYVKNITSGSKDISGMFKDLSSGLKDVVGVAGAISGMLG